MRHLYSAICLVVAIPLASQQPQVAADIRPGPDDSRPYHLVDGNGRLFFWANNGQSYALYEHDPATAATTELRRFASPPSSSTSAASVALGGELYFVADDGVSGRELWSTEGSGGQTSLVADLELGPDSSMPHALTPMGGKLYFTATPTLNSSQLHNTLWVHDPATGSTELVWELFTASNQCCNFLIAVGDTLYFWGWDAQAGVELWKSDGTTSGTSRVADIARGSQDSRPNPGYYQPFIALRDIVYFCADEPGFGAELYRSDGTAAGTYRVKDLLPGSGDGGPSQMTVVGDALFFTTYSAQQRGGRAQLWTSDGTATGTTLVRDFDPTGSLNSYPQHLTACGKKLYFMAEDLDHGKELWSSDGSSAGTTLVRDIRSGPKDSAPRDLFCAGTGKLFFGAQSALTHQMWTSDGTAAGTAMVMDDGFPQGFALSRGQLYFRAEHVEVGAELFVYDPGALRRPLGFACGQSQPKLGATSDPVLGATVQLRVRKAPSGRVGVLLIGEPTDELLLHPAGCHLHVGNVADSIAFVTSASGRWSHAMPIPNDPALRGVTLALQAGISDRTFGRPGLLVAYSNGLHLIPGR